MPVRVVVVRHGERLDEADRKEWHRIRTPETVNDPPLTETGWRQATEAGAQVMKLLQTGDRVAVYSSPTARTLSTAAAMVAGSLQGQAVAPVYGLNCCAAAQHYGAKKGFPRGEPSENVLRGVPLACWPPMGDANQVDRRQQTGRGMVMAVKELAAAHSDGDVLVLVTHREGIWELLQHVNGKPKSGYCNISLFSYDSTSSTLDSWNPAFERRAVTYDPRSGEPRTPPRRPTGGASSPVEAAPVERVEVTIEAALARGSGTVVVNRGGRGGSTGTLLWCTPGVRGNWADGGAVPDGEVVSLLSSAMASEGNEGDFVLVCRASGKQGWVKVKNVHLPN